MVLSIISIAVNAILSIITIIVAVKAFNQGNKQIELSNKQCLFEKRTQKFIKLNEFVESYENNRELLKYAEQIPEFLFQMLSKGSLLDDKFIEEKIISNSEQEKFLKEMENYRTIALEISILWDSEESKLASNFVYAFVGLLMNLFKQYISVRSKEIRMGLHEEVIKILTKDIKLREGIELIEAIYSELKNRDALNILKEQIKVK